MARGRGRGQGGVSGREREEEEEERKKESGSEDSSVLTEIEDERDGSVFRWSQGAAQLYGRALIAAIIMRHIKVAKALIDAGADRTTNLSTALIEMGVDITEGEVRVTPVELAVYTGLDSIADKLCLHCSREYVKQLPAPTKRGPTLDEVVLRRVYGEVLIMAARYRDTAVMHAVMASGADVTIQDEERRTALTWMGISGCNEPVLVRSLAKNSFLVNLRDADGRTALVHAAIGGHVAVIQELKRMEATLTVCDKDGWSALTGAASMGNTEVLKVLLTGLRRVDPNQPDAQGRLSLAKVVGRQNLEEIRILLAAGANPDLFDGMFECTSLEVAKSRGNEEIIAILQQASGKMVTAALKSGNCAMLVAEDEVPKKLLPDLKQLQREFKQVRVFRLPYFIRRLPREESEILELLGKFLPQNVFGGYLVPVRETERSPILIFSALRPVRTLSPQNSLVRRALVEAAGFGDEKRVAKLLMKGADPTLSDDEDSSLPLIRAACEGQVGIVKLLLDDSRVRLDQKDRKGRLALVMASIMGQVAVVRLLLDRGAKPNERDAYRGALALVEASARGRLRVVKMLLEAGANPSQQDGRRQVALVVAIFNNKPEVVELLLKSGASREIAVKCDHDKCPGAHSLLDFVQIHGSDEVIRVVRQSIRREAEEDQVRRVAFLRILSEREWAISGEKEHEERVVQLIQEEGTLLEGIRSTMTTESREVVVPSNIGQVVEESIERRDTTLHLVVGQPKWLKEIQGGGQWAMDYLSQKLSEKIVDLLRYNPVQQTEDWHIKLLLLYTLQWGVETQGSCPAGGGRRYNPDDDFGGPEGDGRSEDGASPHDGLSGGMVMLSGSNGTTQADGSRERSE